jgi:hypothetical protein
MIRFAVAVVCFSIIADSVRAQSALPIVDDVDGKALQTHIKTLVRGLEKISANLSAETAAELRPLLDKEPIDTATANAVQKLLDTHCLMGVSINPESRVKAVRGPAVVELQENEAKWVFVKIHNDAGVTAALTVTGPQIAAPGKTDAEHWLEASVVATAPFAAKLSGQRVEYVVLKLTAREAGKREATFKFDVGQGTQDLGYRAEVPILFTTRK